MPAAKQKKAAVYGTIHKVSTLKSGYFQVPPPPFVRF